MDDDAFRGEVIFTFDGDEAGQKAALKAFDGDQKFAGADVHRDRAGRHGPVRAAAGEGRRRRCKRPGGPPPAAVRVRHPHQARASTTSTRVEGRVERAAARRCRWSRGSRTGRSRDGYATPARLLGRAGRTRRWSCAGCGRPRARRSPSSAAARPRRRTPTRARSRSTSTGRRGRTRDDPRLHVPARGAQGRAAGAGARRARTTTRCREEAFTHPAYRGAAPRRCSRPAARRRAVRRRRWSTPRARRVHTRRCGSLVTELAVEPLHRQGGAGRAGTSTSLLAALQETAASAEPDRRAEVAAAAAVAGRGRRTTTARCSATSWRWSSTARRSATRRPEGCRDGLRSDRLFGGGVPEPASPACWTRDENVVASSRAARRRAPGRDVARPVGAGRGRAAAGRLAPDQQGRPGATACWRVVEARETGAAGEAVLLADRPPRPVRAGASRASCRTWCTAGSTARSASRHRRELPGGGRVVRAAQGARPGRDRAAGARRPGHRRGRRAAGGRRGGREDPAGARVNSTGVLLLGERGMWDPAKYLAFADHRSRPFFDLLARVGADAPRRVVDLGCGPGNLTETLAARWPDAAVEALDSSPEMVAAARERGIDARRRRRAGLDAARRTPTSWCPTPCCSGCPATSELLARWVAALPRGRVARAARCRATSARRRTCWCASWPASRGGARGSVGRAARGRRGARPGRVRRRCSPTPAARSTPGRPPTCSG